MMDFYPLLTKYRTILRFLRFPEITKKAGAIPALVVDMQQCQVVFIEPNDRTLQSSM